MAEPLRDVQALARFDTFLFSAVATVLVVRTLLAVTGYPQVGGGGLHIAHVLWGGLLLGAAIVVMLVVPGTRARSRAALIGGIGFGLFIDEVGKFLTKDVNYFFRPAIAIMYAVFIAAYVGVRYLIQRRPMSDRHRLAVASSALTDQALGQLDGVSRNYALRLLEGVDDTSELSSAAASLREALLLDSPDRPGLEQRISLFIDRMESLAERVLSSARGDLLVIALFVIALADVAISLAVALAYSGSARVLTSLLDAVLPSAVAVVLLAIGFARRASRLAALRLLRTAITVEMLVTQVVVFNRQQWLGLIGFGIDLLLIGALRLGLQANQNGYRAVA